MFDRMAAHLNSGIDGFIEMFCHLGERIEAEPRYQHPPVGVARRIQCHQQRNRQERNKLHPGVGAQVVKVIPVENGRTTENQCEWQPARKARVDELTQQRHEQAHESYRHGQAVPDQSPVARLPVVIGGARAHQCDAAEHREPGHTGRSSCVPHTVTQADEANNQEGQVRQHVQRVRQPQHGPVVGELVVAGTLRDWVDAG